MKPAGGCGGGGAPPPALFFLGDLGQVPQPHTEIPAALPSPRFPFPACLIPGGGGGADPSLGWGPAAAPPPLPVQDYCLAPWEHWGLQLGNHHLLESCDGPATLGDTSAFAGGRGRTRQGCNRNQTSVGFADLLLLFGFGFGFVFFFITQELKNNHKQEPCPGVGEGGEAALPHHIRFTRVAPTPALPCPLRLHKTPFPPKKNPFPPPQCRPGHCWCMR